MPTSSMSRRMSGCAPRSTRRPPDLRRRRATIARSSISDGSANERSERSTTTSSAGVMSARESAGRRRPCVATSSSPATRRTERCSSNETIALRYPQCGGSENPRGYTCRMATVDDVEAALTNVIDPELGLDFVELGLIYGIDVDGGNVHVTFTLTTPACPIGPQVSEQIEEFVGELDGVDDVTSSMIFTPPWSPDKMSEDAKFALGY